MKETYYQGVLTVQSATFFKKKFYFKGGCMTFEVEYISYNPFNRKSKNHHKVIQQAVVEQ